MIGIVSKLRQQIEMGGLVCGDENDANAALLSPLARPEQEGDAGDDRRGQLSIYPPVTQAKCE